VKSARDLRPHTVGSPNPMPVMSDAVNGPGAARLRFTSSVNRSLEHPRRDPVARPPISSLHSRGSAHVAMDREDMASPSLQYDDAY
jgi:hypothetical protein